MDLLELERQRFLEVLVSSDDTNNRDDLIRAQAIARWIGNFTNELGLKHELREARAALKKPPVAMSVGDAYMELDSEQLEAATGAAHKQLDTAN